MARITVEDCMKKVPNRFMLVHMAAKRVRQMREGSEYLVASPKNEDIVVALREIAAGKIKLKQQKSDIEDIDTDEPVKKTEKLEIKAEAEEAEPAPSDDSTMDTTDTPDMTISPETAESDEPNIAK